MTVEQALGQTRSLQDEGDVSLLFQALAAANRTGGERLVGKVAEMARGLGWSDRDTTLAEGMALAAAHATLDVGAISRSEDSGSVELTTDEALILREAIVWVVHRPLMPPESEWPTLTGFTPAEDQEVLDALCIALRTHFGLKLLWTEGEDVDVDPAGRERFRATFLRHLMEPRDPSRPPEHTAEVIDSDGQKHMLSLHDVDFPEVPRAAGAFPDGTQWSLSSIVDPGFNLRWELRGPAGELHGSRTGAHTLRGSRAIQLMFGHNEAWKRFSNLLVAGQVTKDAASVTVHLDDGTELAAEVIVAPELSANVFVAAAAGAHRAVWAEAREAAGAAIARTWKPGDDPWPGRSATPQDWARSRLHRARGLKRPWQIKVLYDWARQDPTGAEQLDAGGVYALAVDDGWDERTATLAEGIVLAARHGPGPFGMTNSESAPPQRRTIKLTARQAQIARAALVNLLYGPYDLDESEFHTLTAYEPYEAQPVLDALEVALDTDIGQRLSLRAGDRCTLQLDTGAEVPSTFVEHRPGRRLRSGAIEHRAEIAYPDDRSEIVSLLAVFPARA